MNQVALGDSVYLHFGTSSVSTGAATNADSTPTVTVAEDGTDMGYAPTVTNVATGLYKAQIDATAGNGFEAGKRYSVYAVATVGGVTGRDGIAEFEVLATDLNTGVASVQGNVTGSVASVTAAVTVGTINTDAVNAAALAADAVAEIQSGLSTLTQANVRTALGMAAANLDTQLAAIAAYVDELETRLTAVRAGLLDNLTNLDAAVSSRLATAGYTAPDNAGIAAVQAQTDQLAFTSGAVQADVQRVRGQGLTGTGSEADPWNPA